MAAQAIGLRLRLEGRAGAVPVSYCQGCADALCERDKAEEELEAAEAKLGRTTDEAIKQRDRALAAEAKLKVTAECSKRVAIKLRAAEAKLEKLREAASDYLFENPKTKASVYLREVIEKTKSR